MSPEEICREYREAKNKRQQISILADQNVTTKAHIIKILAENGENVGSQTAKGKKTPRAAVPAQIPEAVAGALYNGLDAIEEALSGLRAQRNAIDEQIHEKEREYKEIANFIQGNRGQQA